MCIIAVKQCGQEMFPEETIRMMFSNNPDGAGMMWYDFSQRKVVYRKGFMRVDQLLDFINSEDWTDRPVVMHFRIGTSGHKTKLCTHPYPVYDKNHVSGTSDLAVCHNGVLSNYFPGYNSAINDSLNFTQKVLSIDNTGDITLLGNFIEDGGYVYSNSSYKPKEKPKYSSRSYRGYYSSNLFGDTDDHDDEMDEYSRQSFNDYISLLDKQDYQGEIGDFAY